MYVNRVATAHGQPAITLYDWTLGTKPSEMAPNYTLPPEIFSLLLIEKFVDKVSKTLYTNNQHSVGLVSTHERNTYVSFLEKDYEELQRNVQDAKSPIVNLYLHAAHLHLHLSAFFLPPDVPSYRNEMLKVYQATITFLETCLGLESSTTVTMPSSYTHGLSLKYSTAYIFQMMLAAGFSILSLMRAFLGEHELDEHGASEMFTRTVWALRSMTVVENDLAERLAEVLAQVWKSGPTRVDTSEGLAGLGDTDDSLQLKVRCRMSMSLVFDSVWRWRRNYQLKSGRPLEGMFPRSRDCGGTDTGLSPLAQSGIRNRCHRPESIYRSSRAKCRCVEQAQFGRNHPRDGSWNRRHGSRHW